MGKLLYTHQEEDLVEAARIVANEIMERMSSLSAANTKTDKENFLSQNEAAKFLNITVGTLIQWKKQGKVPFYKIGRTIFFLKSELLQAAKS